MGRSRPAAADRWHALAIETVAERLGVDPEQGLDAAEISRRRDEFGPNALVTEHCTSWVRILARQFVDALIAILLVAAVVAWLVGDVTDALTILAIVVLNGALGFVQEWKAERALTELRGMLAPRCRALRDGVQVDLDAAELVPGDVVEVEAGDRVPADLRIVRGLHLRVDESTLTGESVPVDKQPDPVAEDAPTAERHGMAFLGTAVTQGRARAIVVGTGERTELGRVAELTAAITEETTPLQLALGRLGRQLGIAAVAVSMVVAVLGWLAGGTLAEMFLTGVSLAVAVVPEGLPAVVTITLALGVRAMARRHALVRRLQAAEALGATTALCTDKTGTLTENQMTVRALWLAAGSVDVEGAGYAPDGRIVADGAPVDVAARADLSAALTTGATCNRAGLDVVDGQVRPVGDPTEVALLVAARKAGIEPPAGEPENELAFDATRKRMTVVRRAETGLVAHVKGAPETVLSRCTRILDGPAERAFDDDARSSAERAYRGLAERGLRVLALARRDLAAGAIPADDDLESDLTLLGLVGMVDPPRPEVADAVRRAREAGVRVFVVTGDAGPTATTVAREIGLTVDSVVSGPDLDELDDDALGAQLAGGGGVLFARTTPEHKLRLVEVLQAGGHVVGMTGDGVNDAPALKRADVGIAMGRRGTSVARGAADLVLTDDNFASIVGAIEEGRRQFDNVRKFLRNLLSSNVGEVVAILGAILLGGPIVFLPVHLLWINLVTDGLTSLALGAEPAERDVMQRPPRRPDAGVLEPRDAVVIGLQGAWIGVATLMLFRAQLASGASLEHARSVAFTGIVVGELVNAWNYRALRGTLRSVGWLSNPWFVLAWVVSLGLQCAAISVPALCSAFHVEPLAAADWLWIVIAALPVFVVTELGKALRRR